MAGDRHYRVAFRLEAPVQQVAAGKKQGEAAWQLHYLLQARDDASLIVPAAEVWRTKGSVLNALERRFDRPQERLLTGLGYAARFFAPIQRSLQRKHPGVISLTGEEAFAFGWRQSLVLRYRAIGAGGVVRPAPREKAVIRVRALAGLLVLALTLAGCG